MATPVVSGAVALLLQQNSSLTPDQVKARLMKNTFKSFPTSTVVWVPAPISQSFTEYYDLFSVGSGLLNMQSTLSDSSLAPSNVGAALSPSVAYSKGTVSLVYGNGTVKPVSVVWGSSVVWGTSVVWGASVNGSSVVWGASVLPWNDNALSAFSVVWGSSTGTGTQATSVVWGASTNAENGAVFAIGGDQQ
jgi:serine protease AprX